MASALCGECCTRKYFTDSVWQRPLSVLHGASLWPNIGVQFSRRQQTASHGAHSIVGGVESAWIVKVSVQFLKLETLMMRESFFGSVSNLMDFLRQSRKGNVPPKYRRRRRFLFFVHACNFHAVSVQRRFAHDPYLLRFIMAMIQSALW